MPSPVASELTILPVGRAMNSDAIFLNVSDELAVLVGTPYETATAAVARG